MNDIYEVTPEEVREDATPVFGRLHPDDYDFVADAIAESARTLGEFYCEFRVVLPRQGLRWRWSQAHPERTEDGGTLWHGIISDITERRRAQEDLTRERDRLDAILRGTNTGTWEWNVQTGETVFNERWAGIVGYTLQELAPVSIETWRRLAHPDDLKASNELLEQHFKGELDYYSVESCMKHKNGEWVWVLDQGRVATWTKEGSPEWMFGTHTDITERRTAEQALKKSEESLRQSQKMEAVGGLAGGIAHDFNNLLTAIIGQTELLRVGSPQPEEVEEGLSEIRASADRAAALTRQLLAFSRRQALQPRALDLNEVCTSMMSLLGRLLGEQIDLVFEAEPALFLVEADLGQLEQVIMNLAVNARDAMPDGGRLSLETTNVDLDEEFAAAHPGAAPGAFVRLVVQDTGHGMDEKTFAHVFEPFYTTKDVGRGTGLGLSTVYGIVKQSGGYVSVDSEPGKGTTFTIYLPRTEKPLDWRPEKTEGGQTTEKPGVGTVLVVEDEPAVRQLVVRVLRTHGYQVLEAETPEEALTLFEGHPTPIDLLLTDVMLPQMSGRALVEELAQRRGATFPVLYVSGYTRDALTHDGRIDADITLLEKPFTADALARNVREALDQGA